MDTYKDYTEQLLFKAAISDDGAKEELRFRVRERILELIPIYIEKYDLYPGREKEMFETAYDQFDYIFDKMVAGKWHLDINYYFLQGYAYNARQEIIRVGKR